MSELVNAILLMFTPLPFFLLFSGTVFGIVIGAIPGMTGTMGIVLMLPLTFYMTPANALTLLISIYVGAVSGAQITGTLLRIPGTPSAIMTTLDGYPMARAGRPGQALGLGIGASFFGGIVSWIFLVLLAYPLSEIAIRLKPFDYFTLVLMALVLIASVSRGYMVKGLLSGFLGILATLPGVDPATGNLRLTFGFHQLEAGFALLPVLIGVFALGQVLSDTIDIEMKLGPVKASRKGILMSIKDWKAQAVNLVRSSLIGTWIGILPGIGANIGSVVAYTVAKSMSKTPEKFGKGSEEGIVASETGNNATVGGALIPLISMGIPGSVNDAFLLAAMFIHGIQPGPLLYVNNPDIVYAMLAACLIANIAMFLIMIGAVGFIARLVTVPKSFLLPVILVFCILGAYANSNRMFDIWVMLAFGLVGFILEKNKVPLAPFIIGFILAPIAEEKLRAGLMLSGGSYLPLITQPVSGTFVAVSIFLLFWSLYKEWRK